MDDTKMNEHLMSKAKPDASTMPTASIATAIEVAVAISTSPIAFDPTTRLLNKSIQTSNGIAIIMLQKLESDQILDSGDTISNNIALIAGTRCVNRI